jgi:hypothetical protein
MVAVFFMAFTLSSRETARMTPDLHFSRPALLMAITERAVRETRGGVIGFADRVAENYLESVPAEQRRAKIKPLAGDIQQITAAQKANRQTVDRYIKGDVKAFPADLEEAWVRALPEPYQSEALRSLSARYGLLAARMNVGQPPLATMGDITGILGDLMKRMAPIVADGVIDERDLPHIKPALACVADAQGFLASLHSLLAAALPDEQGVVLPMKRSG